MKKAAPKAKKPKKMLRAQALRLARQAARAKIARKRSKAARQGWQTRRENAEKKAALARRKKVASKGAKGAKKSAKKSAKKGAKKSIPQEYISKKKPTQKAAPKPSKPSRPRKPSRPSKPRKKVTGRSVGLAELKAAHKAELDAIKAELKKTREDREILRGERKTLREEREVLREARDLEKLLSTFVYTRDPEELRLDGVIAKNASRLRVLLTRDERRELMNDRISIEKSRGKDSAFLRGYAQTFVTRYKVTLREVYDVMFSP